GGSVAAGFTVTVTAGGGCIGASAIFGTGAAGIDCCIGASASLATSGEELGGDAASGEGCTTRRLAREEDGATAAESADGDSGVTPLDCSAEIGVGAFSAGFSLRILSTVFSVTGFSLRDLSSGLSSEGGTFGCSVTFGS